MMMFRCVSRVIVIVSLLMTQVLAGARCHAHEDASANHDSSTHFHLHSIWPHDCDHQATPHDADAIDLPDHDTLVTISPAPPVVDAIDWSFVTTACPSITIRTKRPTEASNLSVCSRPPHADSLVSLLI